MKSPFQNPLWVLAPLILLLSFSTYEVKSSAQSLKMEDWLIEFRGDKSPGKNEIDLKSFYLLKNDTVKKHVGYGRRDYGINLIWDPQLPIDDGNIRFESAGSSPLKLQQAIAVYVKDGGYLYYKERKYGINLEYSPTPVYQWEFRSADPSSTGPIRLRTNISLYNRKSGDYVLYCRRDYGINLRWAKDCKPKYHAP